MRRILLCVLACLCAQPAYAYRPFNLTDAAVAASGEMEVECGPVGYVVDADGRFLVVPSLILNFGVAEGWAVVIEGRNFLLVQPMRDRRDTLRETAVSVGARVLRVEPDRSRCRDGRRGHEPEREPVA